MKRFLFLALILSALTLSAQTDPAHTPARCVYAGSHALLANALGALPAPAVLPQYADGQEQMRAYFKEHPLTDSRAMEMIFRVHIAVLVNCQGQIADTRVVSSGKGFLAALAEQVRETVAQLPGAWTAAQDAEGNTVDCWQMISFTVSLQSLEKASLL